MIIPLTLICCFDLFLGPPPPPYEPPQPNYTAFSCAGPNSSTNSTFNYSQAKMPETRDENKKEIGKGSTDIKIKQEPPSPESESCENRRGEQLNEST